MKLKFLSKTRKNQETLQNSLQSSGIHLYPKAGPEPRSSEEFERKKNGGSHSQGSQLINIHSVTV